MPIYMSEHKAKEHEENWDAEDEHVHVERRATERVPFRTRVKITVRPPMPEISEDGEYLEFQEDES